MLYGTKYVLKCGPSHHMYALIELLVGWSHLLRYDSSFTCSKVIMNPDMRDVTCIYTHADGGSLLGFFFTCR